jgi:hypothetical protein
MSVLVRADLGDEAAAIVEAFWADVGAFAPGDRDG